jgi:ferredoxin
MVGVTGSGFWPHFKASAFFSDGQSDPLDRWSRAIGEALATQYGGVALYPFDGPPYHPFQRWADRADATQPSRMLLRIHPAYGLWHAYRFALALPGTCAPDQPVHDLPVQVTPDLCAGCAGQPCLQACPVQAYTGETFLLNACATHLQGARGQDCMEDGCLARRACPVAPTQRYTPEHAAFHMQAFAAQHRP